MKVSICCITYQHVKYIEKAILGFLEQRTNFPIEIFIHDDASTDGTADIIRTYAGRDHRIIPILREKNVMSTGDPVVPAIFDRARGEFIAMCEGDDHWIDPYKLQRQIDALEGDPEAVACFTDAYNEIDGRRDAYMNNAYAVPPPPRVDLGRIMRGQGIPTCTFMFRNIDLTPFYDALRAAPVGDTVLFTYLAGKGHFIYQPERTGVRVMHAGGMYSMQTAVRKLDMHLRTLPFMDQLSDHNYSELLNERRRKLLIMGWSEAMERNDLELAKYVWPQIQKERGLYGWNFTTTIRNFFKAYWPLPDRIYGRLTGK